MSLRKDVISQRAFRQRKEGYIKKLEEQVRDLHTLEENYKAVQAENYQLRDYIINLQSRLIESQGEYPQPPSNIDLSQPRQDTSMPPPPQQQLTAPTASMVSSAADQNSHLQASAVQAQAVVEMNNGNTTNKHPHEDAAAAATTTQQQQQHQNLAAVAAAAAAENGYPAKRIKTHGEDLPRTTTTTEVAPASIPVGIMMRALGPRGIGLS